MTIDTKAICICFATILITFACAAGDLASQNPTAAPGKGSDYFPLSVGNYWNYALAEGSKISPKKIRWSVTQRKVVHDNPVYHLWRTPAQDDEPLSLSVVGGGVLEADTDRFLLKDHLHVGEKWFVTSKSLRAKGKQDSFELVSFEAGCSAGRHSFTNCLTIREIDEANNVSSLTTYARGVGPVKYVYWKGNHSAGVDAALSITTWKVNLIGRRRVRHK